MRRTLLALAALPLVAATASAPVTSVGPALDRVLEQAQKEAADASGRFAALDKARAQAVGETAKLQADQQAAVAAIEETEAQIAAAQAEWRLAKAQEAAIGAQLAWERAPAAALLAGLAVSGRRPSVLTLLDGGSVKELVRVRALVDASLPVIRARTAALSGQVEEQQKLTQRARQAVEQLAEAKVTLAKRQRALADLETRNAARIQELDRGLVNAGDRMIAGDEALQTAAGEADARRRALSNAAEIIALPATGARPMKGDAPLPASQFAYELPVDGPLVDGVGSIDHTGIMARGVRFATVHGQSVRAPADGRVLFAAPYRGRDGIVILDHGQGRITMLLNVSSNLARGSKVSRGETIGRALGPVEVEYREKGRILSPAFIAASSPPLSNGGETR